MTLKPFELKDSPSLIENLFPVQKISIESFKEQMAVAGKTLTALGSYWKGRKPLILNKACILGALLPCTNNQIKDLEIFELLMGMHNSSVSIRLGRIKPNEIVNKKGNIKISKYFDVKVNIPKGWVVEKMPELPEKTVVDYKLYKAIIKNINTGEMKEASIDFVWKKDITEIEKLELEAQALPFDKHSENITYKGCKRSEELGDKIFEHIWEKVNNHLNTDAHNIPELVEQLGIARFGHKPKVADVFSGSGQIPFEAARLGCDVYASDLNPIACMLTWGDTHIVGSSEDSILNIINAQKTLTETLQNRIDELAIESDGNGWRSKVYLYCNEVVCPETGWKVPLLPSLIISKGFCVGAELVPDFTSKSYKIKIKYLKNENELKKFELGTVQDGYIVHSPDGITTHRASISLIRGDYKDENGVNHNKLRLWEKSDFMPRTDDIYQERLYCIQWMKPKYEGASTYDYEFRSVTEDDLKREEIVNNYVAEHLAEWQEKGIVPDMVIEKGDKTNEPIRTRGWTHWHHLFNPRQLLMNAMIMQMANIYGTFALSQILNVNCRCSRWNSGGGGGGLTAGVFDNQALNTLNNYGCRASQYCVSFLMQSYKNYPIFSDVVIKNHPAKELKTDNDIFVTDPPYGDAVKYEEITEFFIAWLRKNPPKEFANWVWDSRRALAIKGEGEEFKTEMIAAYSKMAEHMPDNGLQVLMFTHQSGAIWADMTNIIWASGLQVTAAWYVVTETDSALRQGANVKGTIMLVLRKRKQNLESFREDIAWEIEDAVKSQVESMTGLDKEVRSQGAEALYDDADLQMAGYAAALKVLTLYSTIDGKDMNVAAREPRIEGRKSFVDELIDFAVKTAVKYLVPSGFESDEWAKLAPVERYYLKMAELEARGNKTLDNYQNFAKAFKVLDFSRLMASDKANSARLKLATEFKGQYMSNEEIANTNLRAILYAMYELSINIETDDVLEHLMQNTNSFFANKALIKKMTTFLANKRKLVKATKTNKSDVDASMAEILLEALENQKA